MAMRPAISEAVEVVTAPTQTIVPVVRAVRHIKPLETLDLARIDALLHTVDRLIEQSLGAAVLRATRRAWYTPGEARRLQLPEGPIAAVTSVLAFDEAAEDDAGADAVPTTSYRVLAHRSPAELQLREGASWPVALRAYGGLSITYTAGAASLLAVPADIRHAALLLAAHLFEHPTPVVTGKTIAQLPFTVEALLAPHSQRRRCAA